MTRAAVGPYTLQEWAESREPLEAACAALGLSPEALEVAERILEHAEPIFPPPWSELDRTRARDLHMQWCRLDGPTVLQVGPAWPAHAWFMRLWGLP